MIITDASKPFASALKAKAPVVAIPVDGYAPVCVDRKRLAAWSKGVEILSVEVIQHPDEYYCEEITVKGHYGNTGGPYSYVWEGPQDVQVVKIIGGRYLKVTGRVQGKTTFFSRSGDMIRTSAKFTPIARQVAIKTLSAWSEKERLRIEKKTLLGALSSDQKKAMKRAKFEDEGESMIPVMVAGRNDTEPKKEMMGLPISIPEFPKLKFAIVKFSDMPNDVDYGWPNEKIHFSVTELSTGKSAGSGNTAEEAIIDARQRTSKMSAERLEEIQQQIAA